MITKKYLTIIEKELKISGPCLDAKENNVTYTHECYCCEEDYTGTTLHYCPKCGGIILLKRKGESNV